MGKDIKCIRGGCRTPLLRKYDTFNSVIKVGDIIFNYCNTDFYNGYKGGILAEGSYYYICGLREKGAKVLFLTNTLINDMIDMKEIYRQFPSLIPNPNHAGNKIITQILVHSDGVNGGWSCGCITIYPSYWKSFIDMFELNESGKFELVRDPLWVAQAIYEGN